MGGAVAWVQRIGEGIEYAGVAAMVIGMSWAVAAYLIALARAAAAEAMYQDLRRRLGRAILLGLEFLIAGDILRTVAIDPSLTGVAVLGGIVLIRTFLSFTIEMEVEGRWPWQQPRSPE
jgi:uncharacterized membrane protein